jgi:hypothetical protein
MNYHTRGGTVFLAYLLPNVIRENDGTLTFEFFVGVWPFPPRHTAYLYRSNGIVEQGSLADKRWHHTTKVNEHWFKASD